MLKVLLQKVDIMHQQIGNFSGDGRREREWVKIKISTDDG